MVSVGLCVLYTKINREGIAHLNDVVDVEKLNCQIDELNMANANLNSALYFIEEHVVMYIEFNLKHIRYAYTYTFHVRGRYKSQSRVHHATYTCT